MPNRAANGFRLGCLLVLASASAFLAHLPRASFAAPETAQDECLIEVHDQNGAVSDGSSVCQVASGKFCTFSLAVCRNQPGCTPATFKKSIRATGPCNPAKLRINPPTGRAPQSPCGAFVGVKVRTKANGKKMGTCKIRVAGKSSDKPSRTDVDKVVLMCMPADGSCAGVTTTTSP